MTATRRPRRAPTRQDAAHDVSDVAGAAAPNTRDSFFEAVYALVACVPAGQVTTYGWLARRLQRPQHARLVGYALHGVVAGRGVPCHRVVSSQGKLSGAPHFPWPGQRVMLEAEGVAFKPDGGIDLRRFQWQPVDRLTDQPPD